MDNRFTVTNLTNRMYEASSACLRSYGSMHQNKEFYAFGIETYAEYGYFHMALNTLEAFEKYKQECKEMDIPDSAIEEEKWGNPQSWEYFDFNLNEEAWINVWGEFEKSIFQYIDDLSGADNDGELDDFVDSFKQAGENTLRKLIDNKEFKYLKIADDFKTLVHDHSDVY